MYNARLDTRRSRHMYAPTDSPSDVDESTVSSLCHLQSLSVCSLILSALTHSLEQIFFSDVFRLPLSICRDRSLAF
ncbi:hypothetical protein HanPI659440_Chr02g0050451 [Helianthus annuus]|nr:hypothetical protein HanPI659440_Chr02g0050451 [Helianthus annuus]